MYNKNSTLCDCGHDIIDHDSFKPPYSDECFYQYNCDCKKFIQVRQHNGEQIEWKL